LLSSASFGKGNLETLIQNEHSNNQNNLEEINYIKDINYLKESLKKLKEEKYELYEEKTSEIRELKQQLFNLKTSIEQNEVLRASKVENEDKSKKIFELNLILNNKEVFHFYNHFRLKLIISRNFFNMKRITISYAKKIINMKSITFKKK